MKRLALFFSLSVLSWSTSAQNLIRVHPAAGEGDFTSLQTAVNSAVAGDIIYVYPGSYGDVTVDKGVHIYGPGFDVPANTITGVKTVAANAILNNLTLQAGADGASVKGFQVNATLRVNGITGGEITGNRIRTELELTNASSILVHGNYLLVHLSVPYGHVDLNASSNIILRNNIFRWILMNSSSSATVKNNIITSGYNELYNSEIKNNIFYWINDNTGPIVANFANEIQYNVFCNDVGYANNLTGQSRSSLFLETSNITTSYFLDANLQLSPTSPALGAGENGEDCGIFGGSMPYKFSGIPELPLIYELNAPDNASGSMEVNIKVRGEN